MTKILLVEDDKSLREIYGVRLLAEGYDIISAGDGEEALAVAIKDRPALIVSDVMMPKISGFDMLDILRSTTETRDIKVIMMTALSSDDQRRRGESLGADRYLVKSQVGIEDVVRTVHEVLGDAPGLTNAGGQVATPAPSAPAPTPAPAAPAPVPERAPASAPTVSVPSRDDNTPPTPAAPAPAPVQQAAPPQPSQNQNPLPQPTAPFSTQRPTGLGDRIIQPLEKQPAELGAPTVADQMDQELGGNSQPANSPQAAPAAAATMPTPEPTDQPTIVTPDSEPASAPAPPPVSAQPQAQFDEVAADEADLASHLKFEETPREQPSMPEPQASQTPQVPPVS